MCGETIWLDGGRARSGRRARHAGLYDWATPDRARLDPSFVRDASGDGPGINMPHDVYTLPRRVGRLAAW